ncbi:MAG TPA: hypothetical protein VG520_02880 [Candidatus Dormibacteraeota bacterium]|jgi:hypothetical protein|nr:hypothetical protein [Candidatus Dormibacteraeota bacterium]
MSTGAYVAIAVVVVVVIAVAVVVASRQKTARLHKTFGSEYDRTVKARGDRRQAERELTGRVDRRKQLDIVKLAEPARQQYLADWQQVQADFVDAPAESVRRADGLVSQVMSDRGYPMAEFEQRSADISVDHADVVENYRSAHAICMASGQGNADTEDLRRAMTQYRELFQKLLGTGGLRRDERALADQHAVPAAGTTTPASYHRDSRPAAADAGQDEPPPPPPAVHAGQTGSSQQ